MVAAFNVKRVYTTTLLAIFTFALLVVPIVFAENITTGNVTTTTNTSGDIGGFDLGKLGNVFRRVGGSAFGSKIAWILGGAVMIAIFIYGHFYLVPIIRQKRKTGETPSAAFAKRLKLTPPRNYDFLAYVIDDVEKTIEKERFIKLSENLYVSTNITKPSYLYIPEHVSTYVCREGKNLVPCGLAYRKDLMALVVDPELASAHDLAVSAGIIRLESDELDELLSDLFTKEEVKIGEVPISPDTRIAFGFNLRNMIKGHLGILRSANDMTIHFLHTASEAETIEKFMKAAAQIQAARHGWMKYLIYMIMALGIAISIVIAIAGG